MCGLRAESAAEKLAALAAHVTLVAPLVVALQKSICGATGGWRVHRDAHGSVRSLEALVGLDLRLGSQRPFRHTFTSVGYEQCRYQPSLQRSKCGLWLPLLIAIILTLAWSSIGDHMMKARRRSSSELANQCLSTKAMQLLRACASIRPKPRTEVVGCVDVAQRWQRVERSAAEISRLQACNGVAQCMARAPANAVEQANSRQIAKRQQVEASVDSRAEHYTVQVKSSECVVEHLGAEVGHVGADDAHTRVGRKGVAERSLKPSVEHAARLCEQWNNLQSGLRQPHARSVAVVPVAQVQTAASTPRGSSLFERANSTGGIEVSCKLCRLLAVARRQRRGEARLAAPRTWEPAINYYVLRNWSEGREAAFSKCTGQSQPAGELVAWISLEKTRNSSPHLPRTPP